MVAAPAHAQSAADTICSDPGRETIYERIAFALPAGREKALIADLMPFAADSGLSYGAFGADSTDPMENTYTAILQSPEVSVGIFVMTSARSPNAYAYVARSCFSDTFEPWEPYWTRFRAFVAARHYVPVPWDDKIECRLSYCTMPLPPRRARR